MIESVTPSQIRQFRREGFLHVSGFLSEDELTTWRQEIDAAVAQQRGGRSLDGTPAGNKDGHYANVFLQQILLSRISPGVHELMHNPQLGRIACDLAGIDAIRIWHDQALIKEPLSNATAFHRDVPFWSFDSHQAISVWVALDDATLQNGCLYILPGSQTMTDFKPGGIGENMGELTAQYPVLADIEPVPVTVSAGDAIYIDGMVAHGAGPNMTTGYRRAMTCAYMPDGATFNGKRNILSDAYQASLSIGDVLDNDEELPRIFSRSMAVS